MEQALKQLELIETELKFLEGYASNLSDVLKESSEGEISQEQYDSLLWVARDIFRLAGSIEDARRSLR